MSWLTDMARAEIQALTPYSYASWEPGLVRLHANESPWRSPGDDSVEGLNRYPEPHPHALMNRLADHYGVPRDSLLAARGSDEAIDLLIRCYCRAGLDAIVITPPTFGMYAVAARIQGAGIVNVPLRREQDYRLDLDALQEALSASTRLIFLCSPNNPTGNLMPVDAMLTLARQIEGRALLVVDEAYIEFSTCDSLVSKVATHPALVVLRTLSKAFALAGARCGSLIAQAEVVQLLQRIIQPYAVTQLTIEAVFKALETEGQRAAATRIATLISERKRIASALSSCTSVRRVWLSEANYLLVEFHDAEIALRRTHAAGLLIRDFRGTAGLDEALRISIGAPEQHDRLLEGLA